jgi:aminoglycoside 3-N-acetyltransferase
MSENTAIDKTSQPNTRLSLAGDLAAAGIGAGATLLVHSSLSSLGWVSGGAVAVIQALMDVITPEGTLVMPTHSGDLSDPAKWEHPPVPESWWQPIRDNMPAFHPQYTPSRGMGAIPEVFRTMPEVLRSNHPALSFAAWGKNATFVTGYHELEFSLGEKSPLARVYELDGEVLLLGVGFGNNTSFHLAETRARGSKTEILGAPVFMDGVRKWVEYTDQFYDSDIFEQIGEDYCKTGQVKQIKIGASNCSLFKQRSAVDFAVKWLEEHRGLTPIVTPR